jgi:transposase-like protein
MSKFSRTRRTALAGGAAIVVAGGIAATVRAQQTQAIEAAAEPGEQADVLFFADGPEGKLGERRQAWLKAVAGKLGVTPEKLDQAIQDVAKEQGFPPPLLVPFPGGPVPFGGPGTFSLQIDSGFEAAAKAIGISEEQLRSESRGGKSVADIARAHNVDPKVVGDALKAQRRTDIDKAVADGKLPADVATRLKSHLDEEIDRLIMLPGLAGGRGVFRFERSVIGAP